MKKSLLNSSLALCTVGAAVLALGVSKDALAAVVHLPDRAFDGAVILGGLLVLLGLVVLVASFVVPPVKEAIFQAIYGDLNSRYSCKNARPEDLSGLHELYCKYFGNDVPSVDLMRSWIKRCKTAFALLHRVSQESGLTMKEELVGSFKVLPLTAEAVRALETGQVTGSIFKAEQIATSKRDTVAYYVGDVVAKSRTARGMVIAHLNAACAPAAKRGLPIYARPLSEDGLRVMTKHGFVQVVDGKSPPAIGRICKLEIAEVGSRSKARLERLVRSDSFKRVRSNSQKRNRLAKQH